MKSIILLIISIFIVSCSGGSSPEEVVENYLKQADWKQRYRFVIDEHNTKEKMERYYGQYPTRSDTKKLVLKDGHKWKNAKDGDYTQIKVVLDDEPASYYLKKVNGNWLIDWESSLGINEQPFRSYIAQMSKEEVKVRVMIQLTDYYNYQYANSQNTHYSLMMFISESDVVLLHAFFPKKHKRANALFESIKDGLPHEAIIKIKTPSIRDTNYIYEMTDFVKEGWLL